MLIVLDGEAEGDDTLGAFELHLSLRAGPVFVSPVPAPCKASGLTSWLAYTYSS